MGQSMGDVEGPSVEGHAAETRVSPGAATGDKEGGVPGGR